MVTDLHTKKILNADSTLREMVAVNAGHVTNRGETAGWYVAGGEHYVIVCGATDANIRVNPAVARGAGGPAIGG